MDNPYYTKKNSKKSVMKALAWNQGLLDGTIKSIKQIENDEKLNSSYIRRTLRLAHLSSDTLVAICNNKHSSSLILENLRSADILKWRTH